MKEYLKVSEVINWKHPNIMELAKQIASGFETPMAIAKGMVDSVIGSRNWQTSD